MAEYIRAVATASPAPARLPQAPKHSIEQETFGAMFIKNALLRFVISHELGHVLKSTKPMVGTIAETLPAEIRKPEWLEEFRSDLIGALLPLRANSLEGVLADAYIRTSLASPIMFTYFMGLLEQVMVRAGMSSFSNQSSHPPGQVRAATLEAWLKRSVPAYSDMIADVATQSRRNFAMVANQLHIGVS